MRWSLYLLLCLLWGLPVSAAPRLELVKQVDRMDVVVDGETVTSFLWGNHLPKPVLFPIKTLSGIPVTRGFPLDPMPGESDDHPHHMGLSFNYGHVNDDVFWPDQESPTKIQLRQMGPVTYQDNQGRLEVSLDWIGKAGLPVLRESRIMTFTADPHVLVMDFDITLSALEVPVIFKDTKEGFFALRVADWLSETLGQGEYINSQGQRKEKGVWGKRADWVCLQGTFNQKPVSVAMLCHPDTVNSPTYWMARGYGLFAANPLGQKVYEKAQGKWFAQAYNLTLGPREKAPFHFQVLVIEGDDAVQEVKRRYKTFVTPQ